jgi:hypothetical protein
MQHSHGTGLSADALSTPDIILPSQYFELTGTHRLSSEQRLMLAVLVDAINILQNSRAAAAPHKSAAYTDAREWVFAECDEQPFSFENVCDGLAIDPSMLRARLLSLESRGTSLKLRLRLKESGRAQRVTLNRVRRRRSRRQGQQATQRARHAHA